MATLTQRGGRDRPTSGLIDHGGKRLAFDDDGDGISGLSIGHPRDGRCGVAGETNAGITQRNGCHWFVHRTQEKAARYGYRRVSREGAPINISAGSKSDGSVGQDRSHDVRICARRDSSQHLPEDVRSFRTACQAHSDAGGRIHRSLNLEDEDGIGITLRVESHVTCNANRRRGVVNPGREGLARNGTRQFGTGGRSALGIVVGRLNVDRRLSGKVSTPVDTSCDVGGINGGNGAALSDTHAARKSARRICSEVSVGKRRERHCGAQRNGAICCGRGRCRRDNKKYGSQEGEKGKH